MADHTPKIYPLCLKPYMVFQASGDLDITCHTKLSGPNGRFVDFSIDREMAYMVVTELIYHLRRQEEAIANAPVKIPSK